jgi:hypothetical protein
VSISSTNGSVTFSLGGSGAIAYRASKAALNRAMQLVAVHLKGEGITVLLLHPGAVLTERQESFRQFPGMVEMQPSVSGMIEQIAKATIDDTGRFIQYDGATAPSMNVPRSIGLACVLMLVAGCGQPQRPSYEEDLAAITAFNARYLGAINDEDIATLSNLTTEGHVILIRNLDARRNRHRRRSRVSTRHVHDDCNAARRRRAPRG